MIKGKKYELVWSLILITIGAILSIVGYKVFPMVALVLPLGIFSFLHGFINIIRSLFI